MALVFIMNCHFKKNKKGFTLIEMLVAVAIFSVIIAAVAGLFVSGLKVQRQNLATQELLDQTSYAVEYMSRALRMAKKELFGYPAPCLSSYGDNYENTGGDVSKIKFIKFDYGRNQDVCHEFFLQSGILREYKKNLETGEETTESLTSNSLKINYLRFNLTGFSQDDDLQPKVTIYLDISGKENSAITLQTSVSQRNLDIKK